MSSVLLTRIIQFTALTQGLVVDGQGYGLHVHELVVGDGRLQWEQQHSFSDRCGAGVCLCLCLYGTKLTERRVWSLCLMTSCS